MTTAATLAAISAIRPALTSRPIQIAFRGLVEGRMNDGAMLAFAGLCGVCAGRADGLFCA